MWPRLFLAIGIMLLTLCGIAGPARAASCFYATSAGTAPPSWNTYCWLDFSTYSDAAARSAAGQNFSFDLADGSVFSFRLRVASATNPALNATAAPSWTGAAVGNTAFLGIGGRPILYNTVQGSLATVTFDQMLITPPAGGVSTGAYMFVAADAESSNENEYLQFQTNGQNWQQLDDVPPITGTTYPTVVNSGSTYRINGVAGTVGAFIAGTQNPTQVIATIQGGGLQGAMFAVRFASLRLDANIVPGRLNAADQFGYAIRATSSGTAIASGTTTGAGTGPFPTVAASLGTGVPLTLTSNAAAGSVTPFASYASLISCTNSAAGSTTPLPTRVNSSSYSFGALAYGDNVVCRFTFSPPPSLTYRKLLGGNRVWAADQFQIRLRQGGTTLQTATTTGSGSTVTGGSFTRTLTSGTAYVLDEVASGGADLYYYTSTLGCTNTLTGSPATLPTTVGGTLTPFWGDVLTCTLTNNPRPPFAELLVTKSSRIVSDGVSGSNPKALPGALAEYTVTVSNRGYAATTANSVVVTDVLPPRFAPMVTALYGPAVTFTNGSVSSGLNFGPVGYSNAPGGNSGFTYTPVAAANGADAAVTGMRFAPSGAMNGTTSLGQYPSFTIRYIGLIE